MIFHLFAVLSINKICFFYLSRNKKNHMTKTSNDSDRRVYKFKLTKNQDEDTRILTGKSDERQFSFYQICQFPMDKQYSVRKLIYNEEAELLRYSEKKLDKNILDRFLKNSPVHKYVIYPAYELSSIEFPNAGDVLMARSQILNEY
jgi:hypothetical protein